MDVAADILEDFIQARLRCEAGLLAARGPGVLHSLWSRRGKDLDRDSADGGDVILQGR